MSNKHVIGKFRVEATTTDENSSYATLENFVQIVKHQGVKGVGRAFDEIAMSNKGMYLEKVEIDLGTISIYSLESEIEFRLYEYLKQYLQETQQRLERAQQQGVVDNSNEYFVEEGVATLQVVVHFLEKGYFPWNYASSNQRNLDLLIQDLVREQPLQLISKLGKIISARPVHERLTKSVSVSTFHQLLSLLAPEISDWTQLYTHMIASQKRHDWFVGFSDAQFVEMLNHRLLTFLLLEERKATLVPDKIIEVWTFVKYNIK